MEMTDIEAVVGRLYLALSEQRTQNEQLRTVIDNMAAIDAEQRPIKLVENETAG